MYMKIKANFGSTTLITYKGKKIPYEPYTEEVRFVNLYMGKSNPVKTKNNFE